MAELLRWLVGATVVGAVVELGLAVVAVRNRHRPDARAFGWLTLSAGGWSCLQVAFVLAADERVARLAYELAAAVSYQVGLLWFVFAVVYTGRTAWLTRRRTAALWAPVVAYLLARWTEPYHGLTETVVSVVTVDGITAPAPVATPSAIGVTLLVYGYVLAGFALLVGFLFRSRNVSRPETAAIVVAALAPTVGTVASTAGFGVHPGVSLTPLLFAVHGTVTALALFRCDFLDVGPVATDLLAEEIDEPVVVLDGEDVVVDHNPAALGLVDGDSLVGRPAEAVVPGGADRLADGERVTVDAPGYDRAMSSFAVGVTAVEDQHGAVRGRLVHLRDRTAQQRRLDQLTAMQAATQRFIGARTAAEVAEVAVGFAGEVHDQAYAALFRYDDGRDALVSTTLSDELAAALEVADDEFAVPRHDGPLWEAYERGEFRSFEGDRQVRLGSRSVGAVSALVLPLGDHGVLLVGTDEVGGYAETDRQLGRILARTTETALTRVDHEAELRTNRIAVERRNKQIEFFNGVLRHTIRNAMLVVDGHAQHVQAQVDDEEAEKLATVREWCAELTELTEKIRGVNDTVTADPDERLEPVDLAAVVRSETKRIRERCDSVVVDLDLPDELSVAANDLAADVVEAVFSNAVEHNDADGPWVGVTTDRVGEWVQVRVADNGPGLSEEMRTRVFQREMATTQTAHGFGLYFVSVMMDLYDGNVWFDDHHDMTPSAADPPESTPGRGTVVVLEFRLAEAAAATP